MSISDTVPLCDLDACGIPLRQVMGPDDTVECALNGCSNLLSVSARLHPVAANVRDGRDLGSPVSPSALGMLDRGMSPEGARPG